MHSPRVYEVVKECAFVALFFVLVAVAIYASRLGDNGGPLPSVSAG